MDFSLFFLLLVSIVIIGEQIDAGEYYSDAWFKPAYNEVYAYKGPQKTPQQTLEDMKKLTALLKTDSGRESIKFMIKEVDELISINEWPAVCDGESLRKVQRFIRGEKSWQLYIVPYLKYQMGRMCEGNDKYNEAKRKLDEAVKNLDKKDDKELSDFIDAIKKNDKKADVRAPDFTMPALVFRTGVIDYMKSNLKLDKKVKVDEFREIYTNSLVKMCKKYLETTGSAIESVNATPVTRLGELAEDLYPGIEIMWFKKQACTYATKTHFDLPGEIWKLFKHPKTAGMNYRKISFGFGGDD